MGFLMWDFGELFCIVAIFEQFSAGVLNIATTSFGSEKWEVYDKFHIFMRFRKNGSFTPWLQPGEQRYQKQKGFSH